MVVGISVFELHLPEATSLKEKRRVIKSLLERIARRFRVSIIESDFHDLHQRSEIALVLIARRHDEVERVLQRIRELVETQGECYITYWDPQYLEASP